MQILPAKQHSLSEQLFAALAQSSTNTNTDNVFSEEFARYQSAHTGQAAHMGQAVPQTVQPTDTQDNPPSTPVTPTPSVTTETEDVLIATPYTRNTTDGVTYSLQEVVFTKQELHDLYRKLHDAGAPAESLTGLTALLELPDGASLAQVMTALKSQRSGSKLDDAEQNAFKNLLDKIDPNGPSSGVLAGQVAALLQNGKTQEAWQQISRALQSQQGSLNIDRSDLLALGKALGLSDATRQQIGSNFGPHTSLELTPAQLDAILGPIQHEFNERQKHQSKLDKALDSTLTPMLQKARKRMETEKSAGERSSRRTEQSKVLIEKTVMRNVNESIKNTVENDATDPSKAKDAVDPTKDPKDPKDAVTRRATLQEPDSHNSAEQKSGGKQGDAWDTLLRKTDVRVDATLGAGSGNDMGAGGTGAGGTSVLSANASGASSAGGARPGVGAQALSQVEQALLSALRDGTKRLDLQLDPADLGTLSLTLISRNGEVSAVIRSGRSETADMINRQLDVLRTNLEQQGIKVDKLEVQNQAADDRHHAWDSMQQHNARQEEYARRETLDRWRNLGRWGNLHNDDHVLDAMDLEQDMQSLGYAAENARGIYLVA